MTSHIWQRVDTGESYIFYFGIFICCNVHNAGEMSTFVILPEISQIPASVP